MSIKTIKRIISNSKEGVKYLEMAIYDPFYLEISDEDFTAASNLYKEMQGYKDNQPIDYKIATVILLLTPSYLMQGLRLRKKAKLQKEKLLNSLKEDLDY